MKKMSKMRLTPKKKILWNKTNQYMHPKEKKVQTLGFPNQFSGLKVERRLSRSPLSHGLHEGCDDPSAEPPALVLSAAPMGCDPMREREPPFEPCPCPCHSVLPAFAGTAGDDAPAELRIQTYKIKIH